MEKKLRPSRDPNSTKYPDRIFWAGRWMTPEKIAEEKERSRLFGRSPAGRAARRRYEQSEKGKANKRRHAHSEKGKANSRKYALSEKGKATQRRANQSEKGKARSRRYFASEKGREAQARHKRGAGYLAGRRRVLLAQRERVTNQLNELRGLTNGTQ